MSPRKEHLLQTILRRLFVCLLLFTVACKAQAPLSSELTRRIERQVRATYNLPAYVNVAVGQRKPSTELSGYDSVMVTMSVGEKKSSHEFLLSKDEKTLLSLTKMNLAADPFAETASKIDVSNRPMRGAKDAKVTLVVYDDFQCPFCSKMHRELFDDVMKTYGDRVKVYYKDFPLFEIHPWAGRAANNSNCLNAQSVAAYWDFADTVHDSGKQISGNQRGVDAQFAELDRITTEVGKRHSLDMAKLEACMKAQPHEAVDASVKEAESLGIQGTPAIFVNGEKLEGAIPAQEFKAVLDRALRDAGQSAPATPTPAAAK
jgi:protein-disulfide isomerase